MKKIKEILKLILCLILCIFLVLCLLFVVVFTLTLIQELLIADKDYLILASNSFYKYVVLFVILLTFMILALINKKGLVKFNEEFIYYGNLMLNRIFVITFSVISLFMFVFTIFRYDAIYEDRIVSHSIFDMKGTIYEYSDIKEVNVRIKKYWDNSMNVNYILVFDNYNIDILGSIINVKNEKDTYDNNILIDEKIKEMKIKKKVNDKYLDKYNSTLDKKYADKINVLFDK